jgi:hypothetical protein
MESIRIWLNGKQDYKTGVNLYKKFGTDSLLKRLFDEEAISPFKIAKLKEALTGLMQNKKQVQVENKAVLVTAIERIKSERDPQKEWSENMDEVETALWEKWKPLFTEMMHLSSTIYDVSKSGNETKAGEMALRILDLDDKCDALYRDRNHYKQHGQQLEQWPYGAPCVDPLLIPKKYENAKRYMREYRAKVAAKPDDVNAAKKLKEHEWWVSYYANVLKIE